MRMRAEKIQGLAQSDIRRMTRECVRLGGINLGQGICDLPTPPEILESAAQAVRDDLSVYSRHDGIAELREEIARKVARYNQRPTDPEREVIATIGSTGAFVSTCQALLNPGDEVILFAPYYGYHVNTLKVSGCVPVFVTLDPPLAPVQREALEAARSERTRAVLICSPSNPSGKVFTREELGVIAAFCEAHDLLAITDEIYEYILYDGREHVSMASLPGMASRTVMMSGFSKTFSITGWRLGFVVAPPELAEPIGLVNDLFYVCAPTPLQHGLARGMMRLNDSYYDGLRALYQAKRDLFCGVLDEVGLKAHWPQGAYYVLADASGLGCATAREASMKILEEVGVASVPGSAFLPGEAGERLVRFCYAKEQSVLEDACARLRRLRV
jgi:aminotransferase